MMNLARFLEIRNSRAPRKFRMMCATCLQPEQTCFCQHVHPFNPKIRFVILTHPLEAKRRIATGRMSHLVLENSKWLMGHDYSDDSRVDEILDDTSSHSVMLYPGRNSMNLTEQPDLSAVFPQNKSLTVFVVDGTWATARKMVRLSRNLHHLPRVCFTPPGPSNFRVRKQPKAHCYSTIEAIHHTIQLLGPSQGFDLAPNTHQALLHVFDKMVEQQLEFRAKSNSSRRRIRGHKGRPLAPADSRIYPASP